MQNEGEKRILFPNLYNARDLGGLRTRDGRVTQYGRFIRSDEPSGLTPNDIELLLAYPISTIIDLRSDGEIARRLFQKANYPALLYRNISLFPADPDNENDPSVQLAISLSLGDLYVHLLQTRQHHFAQVFRLITKAPPGAILFHCTHGKDRTGMVAALLLSLVGIPENDIINNYAETYEHIRPLVDKLMTGMPASRRHILRSDASNMEMFLRYLHDNYESDACGYLLACGLTEEEMNRVKSRLLDENDLSTQQAEASLQ